MKASSYQGLSLVSGIQRGKWWFIVIIFLFLILYEGTAEDGATLSIKGFPESFSLRIEGQALLPIKVEGTVKSYRIAKGVYLCEMSAPGYVLKNIPVSIQSHTFLEEKLERGNSRLNLVREQGCGSLPKSVEFAPDGQYILSALLGGKGIEVFTVKPFKLFKRVNIKEPYGRKSGFVEILYLPLHKEIWVSQMTTNSIHILDMETFEYKETVQTGGVWSKVIAVNSQESKAYVSNWVSHDVSYIDIESRKVEKTIKLRGIPRGMVFTPDDQYLYVCLFDTGNIDKIRVSSQKVEKTLRLGPGAKRHLVLDPYTERLYASDMYHGSVFVIDYTKDILLKQIPVGANPNTIKLDKVGKYLFISTRGVNNPETYLKKGPRFGKVIVLDTDRLRVIDWAWGRNQPTGLDVSMDKQFLAFSDFRDNNIELYDISQLYQIPEKWWEY